MLWIDTKTDDDARRRGEAQWTPVWTENENDTATAAVPGPGKVDGQFWGDAIKDVQDEGERPARPSPPTEDAACWWT